MSFVRWRYLLAVRTALNLNSGRLLLNGALTGGTLAMNGGVMMRNDAAALDGVRVLGTLDLSTPYNYNGLTLQNYGQLTLLDNTSFVAADGTSPGLIRSFRMASTEASWLSNTRAGPVKRRMEASTPAVFTMQPSSARLP